MKQHSTSLRLSAALLLASTGLPLTSALAQEVQPQADPTTSTPPADTTAPPPPTAEPTVAAPVVEAPAPAPTRSEPVVNTRASGREPASADATGEGAPAERRATRQRPAPTAARAAAPVRPRAAAQPRAVTAAPPAPAPEPAPVDDATSPLATTGAASAPAAAAPPPADLPAAADPAPTTAEASPVAETEQGTGFWPWLVAGALGIGALLLFARRRRRRVSDEADYVAYDEPVAIVDEPVAPVHHEHAPTAHVLEEPAIVEPIAAAAPLAGANAGRPWLDLAIRPVRAGVGDDAARVEFELGVENNGSAPASDVRISAWLLNGNSPEPSEMERALIDRSSAQQRVETMIEPGDGTRIATAVALPREGLEDAILPVVVADARYRLPDGGEGHTAAAFAVGVSRDGELVMFDVDNPSGMHEGVEARLHGEPQRD